MGGRAVATMTFRPLDQGVPDTRVNLIGALGASLVVQEASVWSMGCGWELEAEHVAPPGAVPSPATAVGVTKVSVMRQGDEAVGCTQEGCKYGEQSHTYSRRLARVVFCSALL